MNMVYSVPYIAQMSRVHFCVYSVGCLEAVNWRVDYTLSSSELKEVNEPTVQLKLQARDPESGSTETTVVSVTADKFRVLLTGMIKSLQPINMLFSILKCNIYTYSVN